MQKVQLPYSVVSLLLEMAEKQERRRTTVGYWVARAKADYLKYGPSYDDSWRESPSHNKSYSFE